MPSPFLTAEQAKSHRAAITKHGMAGTPTYKTWLGMVQRCHNPAAQHFDRYGGRGITVCDTWRDDFTNFLDDMGERPEGTTLDRIDNDKGYSPDNCRWSSRKTQSNNRHNNRRYTYRGETRTLTEWCRVLGVPYARVRGRIRNLEWSFERSVETPIMENTSRVDMSGKRYKMLVVVEYHDTVDKRARWLCKCDCGNAVAVPGKELRQGKRTSCGCKSGKPSKFIVQ